MNKYLKFEEKLSESGKTKRFTVFGMNYIALGTIAWHGPWRKYVFFPNPETLFDPYCLQELVEKLKDVQKAHKEKERAPNICNHCGNEYYSIRCYACYP